MKKPLLTGIIKPKDIYKKGKYSYVSWARTSEYLNELASGWNFHLEMPSTYETTGVVWVAPDGTGYLMCYFTDPDGKKGAVYPYSIMDYKNDPMKLEKISAREITDSHRRGFVFCAAKEFNLGSELWSGNEILGSKEIKTNTKDRSAAPAETIFVLALNAIQKAETIETLMGHGQNVEVRYTQGKLTQDEYTELNKQINIKKEQLEVTT